MAFCLVLLLRREEEVRAIVTGLNWALSTAQPLTGSSRWQPSSAQTLAALQLLVWRSSIFSLDKRGQCGICSILTGQTMGVQKKSKAFCVRFFLICMTKYIKKKIAHTGFSSLYLVTAGSDIKLLWHTQASTRLYFAAIWREKNGIQAVGATVIAGGKIQATVPKTQEILNNRILLLADLLV